jgi:hypothetical protein
MKTELMILTLLAACPALAQSNLPELPYKVVPDWPRLPAGWNFRETTGIASPCTWPMVITTAC